jgi:hypothetical protein
MKEYSWNNYNEIEGFLIIKESFININLLIRYKIKNIKNKLNINIYKNNV